MGLGKKGLERQYYEFEIPLTQAEVVRRLKLRNTAPELPPDIFKRPLTPDEMKYGDKPPLKEDLDQFFRVAMSALCHCYDNTKGFYPDKCDCDKREKVHEAMSALIEEHKRIVRKWNL